MSSFRKRNVQKPIPGTRTSPQTGQVITSTGNPSLDSILGGGLPIGSIILIEEDRYTTHSKVLTKYFLAEGVVSQQSIFFGSLDDDPAEFMKTLPKPLEVEEIEKNNIENEKTTDSIHQEIVDNGAEGDKNGMRIAWRYNDLLPVNVEQWTTKIGHHFNLMEQMDDMRLEFAEKFFWNNSPQDIEKKSTDISGIDLIDESASDEQNTIPSSSVAFSCEKYLKILEKLSDTFSESKFKQDSHSPKTLCRICISSLGSPLWYEENFSKDILKFLSILHTLVRNSTSVCFITMPKHLISKYDEKLALKIRNLVDFAIEIESFVGSDYETNPAFKEYSGLVHLKKISAINTLSVFMPGTSDLAFKLRRKKFVIEKLHLPPELEETQTEAKMCKPLTSSDRKEDVNHLVDF